MSDLIPSRGLWPKFGGASRFLRLAAAVAAVELFSLTAIPAQETNGPGQPSNRKATTTPEAAIDYQHGLDAKARGELTEAIGWFRKAAENGSPPAMVSLYYSLNSAQSTPPENEEGRRWLAKAADSGDADAECALADSFQYPTWQETPRGRHLPPANMPEAVRWYRLAADQNSAEGQYHLALCYLRGGGVPQDLGHGLELMRMAADQQHLAAMTELAQLYTQGIGKPRSDKEKPLTLLKHIVDHAPKGTSTLQDAIEGVILRYEYGLGTQKDLVTAADWHCYEMLEGLSVLGFPSDTPTPRSNAASMIGEPDRWIIMVKIPDSGGRSEDLEQVLRLYVRAAKGDAKAAGRIAENYLSGDGVPQNLPHAWQWFSIAGECGDRVASERAKEIETKLLAQERTTAQAGFNGLSQRLKDVRRMALYMASHPQ